MIQEDMIDINVPIQKYVPSYPKKEYTITTKQLAGNISGMPHYLYSDKTKNVFIQALKMP